jgi:hypothetical protein
MTIHILVSGIPLCGFTMELPTKWPIGHFYVREYEAEDATCQKCREVDVERMKVTKTLLSKM